MEFKDKIKHLTEHTPYQSMFLTLSEQAQLQNKLPSIKFNGGYINPERKRAFTLSKAEVTCFKITTENPYLTLSHQNILGSLMSLNIKRETIGDILIDVPCFFVISELESTILNDLTQIGKHPITLEIIDGSNLKRTIQYEESTYYMDSLRLDLLVSKITKKSRNDAKMMIEQDRVKRNHIIHNKPTTILQEVDVISISKYGRFILLDTKNRSKKDKYIVKVGKFI